MVAKVRPVRMKGGGDMANNKTAVQFQDEISRLERSVKAYKATVTRLSNKLKAATNVVTKRKG